MDSKLIAGLVTDLLVSTGNAYLIEKISFRNGSRYTIRVFSKIPIDLHIVSKGDSVFVEFWSPHYASPILIIEYSGMRSPTLLYREIQTILSIITDKIMRIRNL